jgi:hypothetical protein
VGGEVLKKTADGHCRRLFYFDKPKSFIWLIGRHARRPCYRRDFFTEPFTEPLCKVETVGAVARRIAAVRDWPLTDKPFAFGE